MTTISIEFFGFLKEKITKRDWVLPLENPSSVALFREALARGIASELCLTIEEATKMIAPCAIANENGILSDDDSLAVDELISILPPVSGG